ncbi:hypothetical protein HDK77DRAFT_295927 [Phyllosticta capitalensis]
MAGIVSQAGSQLSLASASGLAGWLSVWLFRWSRDLIHGWTSQETGRTDGKRRTPPACMGRRATTGEAFDVVACSSSMLCLHHAQARTNHRSSLSLRLPVGVGDGCLPSRLQTTAKRAGRQAGGTDGREVDVHDRSLMHGGVAWGEARPVRGRACTSPRSPIRKGKGEQKERD